MATPECECRNKIHKHAERTAGVVEARVAADAAAEVAAAKALETAEVQTGVIMAVATTVASKEVVMAVLPAEGMGTEMVVVA